MRCPSKCWKFWTYLLNNKVLSAQFQVAKKKKSSLQKVSVQIWSLESDTSSVLKHDAQTKVIQPYPPSGHVNRVFFALVENRLRLYFKTQLPLPSLPSWKCQALIYLSAFIRRSALLNIKFPSCFRWSAVKIGQREHSPDLYRKSFLW